MTLRETEWLLDNGLGALALGLLPVVLAFWSWRRWRKDPLKLNRVDAEWPLSEVHQRAFVFSLAAAVIAVGSGMFMQLIGEQVLLNLDDAVLNWRKLEFVDAPMFVKVNAMTGYLAERLGPIYVAAGLVGVAVTIAVVAVYVRRYRQPWCHGTDAADGV